MSDYQHNIHYTIYLILARGYTFCMIHKLFTFFTKRSSHISSYHNRIIKQIINLFKVFQTKNHSTHKNNSWLTFHFYFPTDFQFHSTRIYECYLIKYREFITFSSVKSTHGCNCSIRVCVTIFWLLVCCLVVRFNILMKISQFLVIILVGIPDQINFIYFFRRFQLEIRKTRLLFNYNQFQLYLLIVGLCTRHFSSKSFEVIWNKKLSDF